MTSGAVSRFRKIREIQGFKQKNVWIRDLPEEYVKEIEKKENEEGRKRSARFLVKGVWVNSRNLMAWRLLEGLGITRGAYDKVPVIERRDIKFMDEEGQPEARAFVVRWINLDEEKKAKIEKNMAEYLNQDDLENI